MPVYAYRCENCAVQFERIQRFSDDPVSVCPECEGSSVQRVIQPAGIIFKGSGWYVKDSKAANPAGKPGKAKKDDVSSSPSEKSSSPSEKSGSPSEKSGSPSEKSGSPSEKSGSPSESASNNSED